MAAAAAEYIQAAERDATALSYQGIDLNDPVAIATALKTDLRVKPAAYPSYVKTMQVLLGVPTGGDLGAQSWRLVEHILAQTFDPVEADLDGGGLPGDGATDASPIDVVATRDLVVRSLERKVRAAWVDQRS